MKKIKLLLAHKTVPEKIDQGNNIKSKMTGNANFTTPNPSLPSVGTAVTNLQTTEAAKVAAYETAKQATVDMHAAEKAYDLLITQLAAYAESVTAGDESKLLSGGFELRKSPTPVTELGQVQKVQVTPNGFPEHLISQWEPLAGADVYEVQTTITPDVEESWRSLTPAPKSKVTIDGLTSTQRLSVRVRGVTKEIVGPWSSPVAQVVP